MKTNWQIKKLNEVCNIQTGKWDANHAIQNGKYRFYTCAYEYCFCNTKRFSGESIILPGNGVNVGEIFYYKGDFDAYQRTYVINNIKVLPKFLYYHLLCFWKERNLNKQFGSATNFLKIGNFQNYEISYPESTNEQHRIVKILDEVFADTAKAKENAKKNLQNSRELFESYLQSVFVDQGKNWEKKTLDVICDVEYGYTEKAKSVGDYRFVRITDTDENGLLTQEKKMYVDSFNDAKKYILTDGDLLMARTGASAGNVMLFEGDEKAVFASYLIRMKFKKEILSKLYWHFSKSKLYWDQVMLLSAGSAQPQFNGGALKQIIFSFPKSLPEQKSIVKKLDALSAETKKLEMIYKQKLADLEELKKSVLKKAFKGEL